MAFSGAAGGQKAFVAASIALALFIVPAFAQENYRLRGANFHSPLAPSASPSYLKPQQPGPAYSAIQGPVALPPVSSAMPERPRSGRAEDNPYAPLGLRRGAFLIRPSVETALGADSNVNDLAGGGRSSFYSRIKPDVTVESDWLRHAFFLHLGAERFDYFSAELEARNLLDLSAKGRIDIRRDSMLELGAGFQKREDDSGLAASLLPFTAVSRPDVNTLSANAAYSQGLSRLRLRLSGNVEKRDFGETGLSTGASLSNDERNVTDSTLAFRTAYEWTKAVQPFAETGYTRHDYDIALDSGGFAKGSNGLFLRGGSLFDFGPFFSGEVALGLLHEMPYEGSAQDYTGLTFDGVLNYAPSELTTIRFSARTAVLDDVLVGAVGGLSHDLGLAADYAATRQLTLNAALGTGYDAYEGLVREDMRFSGSVGAAYAFSRNASLTGKVEHRLLSSTAAGQDSEGTLGEVGLKLQY